jgi:2,5-diamino-6-(ribosylamino)-4(3H)-pyrimidinone 5'-phosphate reductase
MLPRVVLHNATSVDGRMDWLTVDLGLYYELASRWEADAMLSGSNTLLTAYPPEVLQKEDPSAFEAPRRDPDDQRQLLAIVDSRGRLRNWHLLRKEPYWRDVIAMCSRSTPPAFLEYLQARHIETIIAGDDRVDLRAALEELNARYGVKEVRVDSGGILNGVLLRAGLVDEVSVLVHPSLVGGATPSAIFQAPDLTSPEDTIPLRLTHLEQMAGDVVWLRYDVIKRGET